MHRVLVVPWSIAATYFAMGYTLLADREERVMEDAAQQAADQRSHHRHPGIRPVRRALAGDRQDRMHDAGAEVTGRVDGIPGRPAEAHPDADHDQGDEQDCGAALGDPGVPRDGEDAE